MSTLTKYEIHPAANLFPMMDGESFSRLKTDIQENGVKEYIVLLEGRILDGRNRYKAMRELGIDPAWHAGELEQCDDPIGYVLSLNLHRRHLTTSQRATIAAEVAKLRHGSNQHAKNEEGQNCPSSLQDAADALGVARRSVVTAKHVAAKGDKSVSEAVKQGDLPVSLAAKLVDTIPDKKEQKALVAKGRDAIKDVVKAASKQREEKPSSAAKAADTSPKSPSFFEQFKALWDRSDEAGRHAIRLFVMDDWNKR